MLQFILWAVGTYIVLGIANMIIALPVGAVAEFRWSELDLKAKEQGQPTSSLLPLQTWLTVGYGVVAGGILAFVLASLTLRFVSDHWAYQLCLLAVLFFASMHAQSNWIKSSQGISRQFFGETGDRFCSLMYGGYFWGSLVSLVLYNLVRWFA